MVFYNVYSLIASYIWGEPSDLENQKLHNEPIQVINVTEETLQEHISNLNKVVDEKAELVREEIERNKMLPENEGRPEIEIAQEAIVKVSEFEMKKVKGDSIRVMYCMSSDLREHISNLRSIGTYEVPEIPKKLTIQDEIRDIQDIGAYAWLQNRKKL